MSLADELLADLEEDGDTKDDIKVEAVDFGETRMETTVADAVNDSDTPATPADNSVRSHLTLANSHRLRVLMAAVEECFPHVRRAEEIVGAVEADPEYQLLVEANQVVSEFDSEIGIIHKFCRDVYNRRFPELESLISQPLEYMLTIQQLGNDLERVKNNDTLQQMLTQATIMVVSVTASTTQGQPLSDADMARLMDACQLAVTLNQQKMCLYEFIESRMNFIAPNLTALIGADTAAKLMGTAGGLTPLSKMPACNIMVVGAQRRALAGFSQTASLPHTGFLYYCQLVQSLPPDLRRKAARLLASKVALASRVDSFHSTADGSAGAAMREEVDSKLEKWQEPPPVKAVRALPAPVDAPGKRRGGRRVRKMKERYAVTELRKQANRMTFGEIEDDVYQGDLGYTRGNIGKGGTGTIRGATIDEKTKVRISKTLQRNLQKQQTYGGTTTIRKQVAGTASSVAFTPLQGLEIINPQAAEQKKSDSQAGYFSSTAAFIKVKR